MSRIWALVKKLYYDKRIRFLFVGGLNTIVGYGTFALFAWLGQKNFPSHPVLVPIVAQTLSQIIGTIHSYFWNKYFTFSQKKKSGLELLRFVSVYAVSFGLSLLINYLVHNLGGVNIYVTGLMSLVVTTLLSYFGHNFFTFRTKKNTATAQDASISDSSDKTADPKTCVCAEPSVSTTAHAHSKDADYIETTATNTEDHKTP